MSAFVILRHRGASQSAGLAARAAQAQASQLTAPGATLATGAKGIKRRRSTLATTYSGVVAAHPPTKNSGKYLISCRHISHGKDNASALPTKRNKRPKRQNIKRQVAPTKREKMLSPAKAKADATADFPGEFAVAIKERLAPTVQTNVETIRDYAKSLFKSDHPRAKRVGPKMDRKWWAVNIALALSPAVMIALVCEYQRGPMEEYFQGVRERERKRIMGEFDIEEKEAEAALAQLGRIPLEEESKKTFSDRVADSASILYTSAMGMITGDEGGSDSGDKEIDHQEETQGTQTDDEQKMSSTPADTDTSEETETDSKTPTGGTSINELLWRIEALEKQVQLKTVAEEREKQRRAHQIKYRLERADQSGVQNRMEDGWIDEWKRKREEQKRKLLEAQTSDGKQVDLTLTGLIKENMRRKEEAVREFGKSSIDAMKEAVLGSSDTPKERGDKIRDNRTDDETAENLVPQSQSAHAVAVAVQKVAVSVQESATSTKAAVDAIKKGHDATTASKLAAKAANDAKEAAKLAREASNISKISADTSGSSSIDESTSSRQEQGALRRVGGWIRSRIGGRSNSNDSTRGEDPNSTS